MNEGENEMSGLLQMEFHKLRHSQQKRSPSSKPTSSAARVTQPRREQLTTTIAQPDMGENNDYVFQLSCKSLKDNQNMPLRLDRQIDEIFKTTLAGGSCQPPLMSPRPAIAATNTRNGIKWSPRLC
ncbi:hypothetical protein CN118_32290 [Sinorhizobium meliloti]|nr:hypothetical protein CN118_32290 [Sinorhizobium meliloti]